MTRFAMCILFACSLALSSISLVGCQTVEGIGQDMQETGDFVSGNSAHNAYHQDARDF